MSFKQGVAMTPDRNGRRQEYICVTDLQSWRIQTTWREVLRVWELSFAYWRLAADVDNLCNYKMMVDVERCTDNFIESF